MLPGSGFAWGRYRTTSNARGSTGTERRLRTVGKRVSRRSSQLTCWSPISGVVRRSESARCDGAAWSDRAS
jgi:hypothetical protein